MSLMFIRFCVKLIFQVLVSMATWLFGCFRYIYKHEWLSIRADCQEPVEHEDQGGKLYESLSLTSKSILDHLIILQFVTDVSILAYFYKNYVSQLKRKFRCIFSSHTNSASCKKVRPFAFKFIVRNQS